MGHHLVRSRSLLGEGIMTTDIAPWFSMNCNISRAMLGSAQMSPVSTFQSRNGSASNAPEPRGFQRTAYFVRWRLDWLAGHIGFELANPSASYLIVIAWQLRLR